MEMLLLIKQKTTYDMHISDWSSNVCASDLNRRTDPAGAPPARQFRRADARLAGQGERAVAPRADPVEPRRVGLYRDAPGRPQRRGGGAARKPLRTRPRDGGI